MTEKEAGPSGSTEGEEEELFDLIIPPGVPRSIIAEITKTYDVELVTRKERLYFANMEGDERELLAFRGKKDVIEAAQETMFTRLQEFIGDK